MESNSNIPSQYDAYSDLKVKGPKKPVFLKWAVVLRKKVSPYLYTVLLTPTLLFTKKLCLKKHAQVSCSVPVNPYRTSCSEVGRS